MEKGKIEREDTNKSQYLGFISQNILGHSQDVSGAHVKLN